VELDLSVVFPVRPLAFEYPGLTYRHSYTRRAGIPLAAVRLPRPGPRVVRRVEPKAGCVPAPISLRLPPDCWWFIQIMRSSPLTPVQLPEDVLEVLNRAPEIELATPLPEPRYVVYLSRHQAEALLRWLQALLDNLSQQEDELRLTCLHCISRLAVAIRRSETQ
jgi:hypothetical protein